MYNLYNAGFNIVRVLRKHVVISVTYKRESARKHVVQVNVMLIN